MAARAPPRQVRYNFVRHLQPLLINRCCIPGIITCDYDNFRLNTMRETRKLPVHLIGTLR
jgi:hypothetical protein